MHHLGPGLHQISTQITHILQQISLQGCKKGITISSQRYLSIAITQRYFHNSTIAHTALISKANKGYNINSDSKVEQDSPQDTQAYHRSLTTSLVYSRLITEGYFKTNKQYINFQFISKEQHRLLGFLSAINRFREVLTPKHKQKTLLLYYKVIRNLQLRQQKTLQRVSINQELGHLYRKYIQFRSK